MTDKFYNKLTIDLQIDNLFFTWNNNLKKYNTLLQIPHLLSAQPNLPPFSLLRVIKAIEKWCLLVAELEEKNIFQKSNCNMIYKAPTCFNFHIF